MGTEGYLRFINKAVEAWLIANIECLLRV